ncbi:hypothetical protein [Halobacillus karajensis]|uniref:hypothetical protein n=1 Tax=Halobacillus karajensis TaxID=195088 RepID=UPI00055722A6|nr:hypothetical protein [Halobacillus karajensis]
MREREDGYGYCAKRTLLKELNKVETNIPADPLRKMVRWKKGIFSSFHPPQVQTIKTLAF